MRTGYLEVKKIKKLDIIVLCNTQDKYHQS